MTWNDQQVPSPPAVPAEKKVPGALLRSSVAWPSRRRDGGSHLASGASISSQAANPGQSTEEAILNKARRQTMRPLQRVHRYGLWSGHTGSSGSSAWKASLWRYTLPGHLSGAELLLFVRHALAGFLGWGRSYHPTLSSGGHSFPLLLSKVGGAVNSGTLPSELCWMLSAPPQPINLPPTRS